MPAHRGYDGIGPVIRAVNVTELDILIFAKGGMNVIRFATVAHSALGLFMWRRAFISVYTAQNEHILRR